MWLGLTGCCDRHGGLTEPTSTWEHCRTLIFLRCTYAHKNVFYDFDGEDILVLRFTWDAASLCRGAIGNMGDRWNASGDLSVAVEHPCNCLPEHHGAKHCPLSGHSV